MKNNSNDKVISSEESVWRVKAQTASHLDYWIKEYFDRLTVEHQGDGTTLLSGNLPDLPALYGFILMLRDAGVDLLFLQAKKL